jgi:hypothetical protein
MIDDLLAGKMLTEEEYAVVEYVNWLLKDDLSLASVLPISNKCVSLSLSLCVCVCVKGDVLPAAGIEHSRLQIRRHRECAGGWRRALVLSLFKYSLSKHIMHKAITATLAITALQYRRAALTRVAAS